MPAKHYEHTTYEHTIPIDKSAKDEQKNTLPCHELPGIHINNGIKDSNTHKHWYQRTSYRSVMAISISENPKRVINGDPPNSW